MMFTPQTDREPGQLARFAEAQRAMDLATYLAQQKQDLVKAFVNGHYPVGVRDTSVLSKFIVYNSTWQWNGKGGGSQGFVRTVEGGRKEYWVDVSDKGYRNGFKNFLHSEYKLPVESVTRDLHADHMLNKAFAAKHGMQYVRMAIVPSTYNQGWGGQIEKVLTNTLARDNSCYRLDYFIFMKVMNILPPADEADYRSRRTTIAKQIATDTALSLTETLQGMDGTFSLWKVI
jgi:hypothetical protein